MEKRFIFYIIIIIAVLGLLFLSQQAYSKVFGQKLISAATDQAQAYVAKGAVWASSLILPKISEDIQSGGATITNNINQAKENAQENILKKVGNYFSGISNAVQGKNNCEVPAQNSNP